MKNYLVITGDDIFSQLSFTVIDSSHLFLVGTLYSQINNSYYKGGIITLSFDGGAQDPIIDSENHLAYYLKTAENKYRWCTDYCLACNEVIIESVSYENCLLCDNSNEYYLKVASVGSCIERNSNPDRYYFNSQENKFTFCTSEWYRDENNDVLLHRPLS